MASDLMELARKVEALDGPSREVDAEIYQTVWPDHWRGLCFSHAHPSNAVEDFTASLDAAMALVPDEHRAGVLHHALQNIQRTGFPKSTFLQRLILDVIAQALRSLSASKEQQT